MSPDLLPLRFRRRVRFVGDDGCWAWTGPTDRGGYGMTTLGKQKVMAHRVVYELLVGPIPEGLHLDHLCRRRECLNPAHLEPVTQAENNRRAGAAKTHCIHGHEYTPENTYRRPRGVRECRACRAERTLRVLAARRAAA
jgi:hypothetical protein